MKKQSKMDGKQGSKKTEMGVCSIVAHLVRLTSRYFPDGFIRKQDEADWFFVSRREMKK
ncbi:MAG: hypothetical protein J6K05_01040 [Bacteroidaceae bacterium]|nr:hypothetical protein [Bacteroidaceae bacterium]